MIDDDLVSTIDANSGKTICWHIELAAPNSGQLRSPTTHHAMPPAQVRDVELGA
jgi:hypothetical protein